MLLYIRHIIYNLSHII